MQESLTRLEAWLETHAAPGELSDQDRERLLRWAMRLTGSEYGYLRAREHELHLPEPSLVTVPETPWPGVSLQLKACLHFAAHTAGGPLVFPNFPPSPGSAGTTLVSATRTPFGDFVQGGGAEVLEFPSPGTYLAAPLPGYDRYSGILLDGAGNLFGAGACRAVARLTRLAQLHGSPWPDPDELLGVPSQSDGSPVLEHAGVRLQLLEPVTIGQDDTCTLRMLDGLTSRRHAIIVPLLSGEAMVIDLKSSNGTFVNGERVEQRILRHGDVVHTAKRNWTIAYRRVCQQYDEEARPPGENVAGFPASADQGARLGRAVGQWRGELDERVPLSLYLELVACQFQLTTLALLWWHQGQLRFCGAVSTPRPGPLAAWGQGERALLRHLDPQVLEPIRESFGGVLVAQAESFSPPPRVLYVHKDGADPAVETLREVVEQALGKGSRPPLPYHEPSLQESLIERARGATSGVDCKKRIRAYYQAGFPAEARALAQDLEQRFLDGDELHEIVTELDAFAR